VLEKIFSNEPDSILFSEISFALRNCPLWKRGRAQRRGFRKSINIMKLKNLPEMEPFRRKLRKQMTAAEVALWLMIKNKQLNGQRFLRQYSIGHYVVDFYCPKYKLAIELDGEGHFTDEGESYDAKRTEYLNSLGVRVLRFENFEVFQYPMRTLDEIKMYLK